MLKINGNASGNSSFSGESVPVGPNSAEVIITQDVNSSGVVKKPGFSSSVSVAFSSCWGIMSAG